MVWAAVHRESLSMIFFILFFTADLELVNNPESILRFADYLFEEGEYEQAIGEYRRYLFASGLEVDSVRMRMVKGWIKLGKYHLARLEAFRIQNEDLRNFLTGKSLYYCNRLDSARTYLGKVSDTTYRDQARAFLGLAWAKGFNFSEAGKYILLPEYKIGYRNPVLSGLFSIIPGLGQAYSGRWGDGLYAISTILIGSIATYYYYKHDEDLKFSIALGVTSVFYVANIYSAIVAAKNYNLSERYFYFKEIERQIVSE